MIERFVDLTANAGLGVSASCLNVVRDLIDRVIAGHHRELKDAERFVEVLSDFEELTRRMIRDARSKGYGELHEDTVDAARQQCGLIFWCSE